MHGPGTLYKLIYGGIFYPAFFLCAYGRSFETASFCLKFWLFLSRRPRKLILSIFSKSKRPFEKQTTPRLVTYLCLSMDKIWAEMIFLTMAAKFRFLLDFYRHLLLMEFWLYNKIQCKETACVPLVLEWYRPRQNNHCECPSNRVHLMWADWKR